MESSWQEISLGEFIRLQRGHDLTASEQKPGNVPVIGSAGPNGFHDKALCQGPGLTIGRSGVGSMGTVTFVPQDFWPHNTVLYATDFLGNDPRFAYYFLTHFNLRRFNSGSAQASLNRNYIYPLPIRVPKLTEQKRIAHILGTLDDKIELNRRMNTTLEAIAQALFKSWFVDFDPVRAKASGEAEESICQRLGLTREVLALFPDRLVESELGEIPADWRAGIVAEIGDVICGKTPSTRVSDYYGDDIPFITIPDMHGKVFATSTARRLSKKGALSQPNKTLPSGSICISCIATPGLVVLTTESSQTNQQINSVIPNKTNQSYFWYWAMINLGSMIISSGSGGSVLTNLSKGRFETLKLLIPPHKLITAYHSKVSPLFEGILTNYNQAKILGDIRDTLLPKLLSGELSVADAKEVVEAVA